MLSRDGMETKVWILPYVENSIHKGSYIQVAKDPIAIMSVRNNENTLVEIELSDGHKVVAKAEQLITAIHKCTL